MERGGKKTAAAIHQEIAREVDTLLRVIFTDRRQRGSLDLEAVEVATRAAMHRAGAAALTQMLSGPEAEPSPVDCPCGQRAHYHDLRNKRLLTVVGPVEIERAYYVCRHCGQGQAPRDRELDVEGTECSPGVRRMMAVVGSEGSFEQGREQLEALAGLEVTAKAVERQAEAIGSSIGVQEQAEIHQTMQGDRPATSGPEIPVLYIEMDGTGVPVVAAETKGRPGKVEGQPARTREAKLGCVFTQTGVDPEGRPVRDPESTTYTGAIETAEEFGRRLYAEVCHRGGSRAKKKVVIGDGAPWIWNLAGEHFPERCRLSIFTMPGNTSGNCRRSCSPRSAPENDGRGNCSGGWIKGRSQGLCKPCVSFRLPARNWRTFSTRKRTTLNTTPDGCVIRTSGRKVCSSAPASSRPAVNR